MNTTRKNILANYAGRAVSLFSVYIFTPFYIKLLGIEYYAIIGFYTLIFSIISFADAGLSSAINREFAKANTDRYRHDILVIFERIYFSICGLLCLALVMGAPLIARYFLNTPDIPIETLTSYVRLIGIGVSLQFASSLYLGSLMGMQRQIVANTIQVGWSLARTGIVFLPLYFIKPNLYVFFGWTIICNLVYLFLLRKSIIQHLNIAGEAEIKSVKDIDKTIWKYIGGMIFIAILSALNMQIDKLFVSRYFTLKEYGYYNLATILAQVPLITTMPIATAVFPALTKTVHDNNSGEAGVYNLVRKFSFLINALVIPIGLVVYFYGEDLLRLWTTGQDIPQTTLKNISTVLKSLTVGNCFMAWQLIPFYYLLAKGKTRYTAIQTAVQLALMVPALYLLKNVSGIGYMGLPWAITNIVATVYLAIVMERLFIKKKRMNFYSNTLVLPTLTNIAIMLIIYQAQQLFVLKQPYFFLIFAGLAGVIMLAANYFIFKSKIAD